MENKLAELINKTLVEINGAEKESDLITMFFSDGTVVEFYHSQDCCEYVSVNDVIGDVSDLLNTPLLVAEERVSTEPLGLECEYDSFTWTFYEFATIKGSVTIRWYGSSNGYYSESVDIKVSRG